MIWFENCGDVFETEDLATSDEEANECEEESYFKENHNNNIHRERRMPTNFT